MHMIKLSSQYKIVIPKKIREQLSLRAGQKFLLVTKGNVIMLVPQLKIGDVKGIMAGADTSDYRDRIN